VRKVKFFVDLVQRQRQGVMYVWQPSWQLCEPR
jgi:hypothetical protein